MHNQRQIERTLSIGLPVYNGENFLEETLQSILNQSFMDFELIISDNGSTDLTQDICLKYKKADPRIKYYRYENNRGAAWNYNNVFKYAKGHYFKYLNHDDLYHPFYLEKCIKKLEDNPEAVLCYTRRTVIDGTGKEEFNIDDELVLTESSPSSRFKKFLKRFRYTTYWAVIVLGVIRRDALAKTELMKDFSAADMILLAQLALQGNFLEVDEYLLLNRRHEQMSNKANFTTSKLAEFYNPSNKNKICLPRWRWLSEFYKTIYKSRLKVSEKLKCTVLVFQWNLLRTKSLIADLVKAAIELYHRQKNKRNQKYFCNTSGEY